MSNLIQAQSLPNYEIGVTSTQNGCRPFALISEKEATRMKEIRWFTTISTRLLLFQDFAWPATTATHAWRLVVTKSGVTVVDFVDHAITWTQNVSKQLTEHCDDWQDIWDPQCFAIYKQLTKNGTTYCDQFFVCDDCEKFAKADCKLQTAGNNTDDQRSRLTVDDILWTALMSRKKRCTNITDVFFVNTRIVQKKTNLFWKLHTERSLWGMRRMEGKLETPRIQGES